MRLLFIAFAAASLSASTLTVSESGTFSGGVETSAFSAPDETWSFSFDVDSNPSVSNVSVGNWFDVAFTDFSYTLNGAPVTGLGTPEITVFSAPPMVTGGLFQICFQGLGTCSAAFGPEYGLSLFGPQIYSGSESSPTILAGSYSPTVLDVVVDGLSSNGLPGAGPVTITPEPSSVTLLACGSALLLCVLVRSRKRAKV